MKTILITGGSGYLGQNLATHFKQDYNIIIGSRNNKNNIQSSHNTDCESTPLDVTSMQSVRDAINRYNPHIIIHAAATKFVDLSEKFPMECVDVNVTGSQNIIRAAIDNNVETVLGISTDKASPPIRNTYGLSKSLMERMFCSANESSNTKFACARYGNVAWSTGSMLPIFKNMINTTGHIKSTGPDMRRFFFTVNHAVDLIDTLLVNIDDLQGKILSCKMKSATVRNFLDVIVKYKQGEWSEGDIRPGERDDEFLIGESELPYTRSIQYKDKEHYIISFNEKIDERCRLPNIISSANAEPLTETEILNIINYEWD